VEVNVAGVSPVNGFIDWLDVCEREKAAQCELLLGK
jgi:hypothetical protein